MNRAPALFALLSAAMLALAACSGSSATPTASTGVASAAAPSTGAASASGAAPSTAGGGATACAVVTDGSTGTAETIKDFAFPAGITIKVGDKVTWSNGDTAPHTVTFDTASCDSGQVTPGSAVTVQYTAAGTFAFHCKIHPRMTGTITVNG